DFDSWHQCWLDLAKRAEREVRWLDAATYYHQAEFYLPAGEVRNGLYDDFSRTFARGMEGQENYERFQVPYESGSLPGFRLRAAAFEHRIEHVVALPATYWGLDMALRQMFPGRDRALMSLFRAGDRDGVEEIVTEQRKSSTNFNWAITQGMHITGTKTPFDCL